jgi:hypothetical protein
MQIKKVLMLVLVLTLLAVPVYASDNAELQEENVDVVSPRFTNISVFYNDFEINENGKAMLTSSITSRDTDEIKISTYLQRYEDGGWITVKHWTTIQLGTIAVLGEQWYVTSGHQYRMKSYAYVYKNNEFIESTTYTSGTKLY